MLVTVVMSNADTTRVAPGEASAPTDRLSRRGLILGVGIPALLSLGWSFLLRPEVPALIAPLLGPWAGHLFGHDECTMANALPQWSWAAVGLGVAAIATARVVRTRSGRWIAIALLSGWSLVWSGLALLSVLNSCE